MLLLCIGSFPLNELAELIGHQLTTLQSKLPEIIRKCVEYVFNDISHCDFFTVILFLWLFHKNEEKLKN
jgi:hypothetical protein